MTERNMYKILLGQKIILEVDNWRIYGTLSGLSSNIPTRKLEGIRIHSLKWLNTDHEDFEFEVEDLEVKE